jgi:hypothetical protein
MADRAANIDLIRAALKLAALQNAHHPNSDIFIEAIDALEELTGDPPQGDPA